jgi:hypothetical protein
VGREMDSGHEYLFPHSNNLNKRINRRCGMKISVLVEGAELK